MRVYIETYGCALNRGDSALMKSVLIRSGHEIVDNPEDADVIVINTCVVRYDTEVRMFKRISELAKISRGKKLIVAGCMARTLPYTIHRYAPSAILLSPQNIHRVAEVVERGTLGSLYIDGVRTYPDVPVYAEGVKATIPVAEGCLDRCSFCIVRIARPVLRSIAIERVVSTVKELVSQGVKEIEITAQDLGVYGYDLYGRPAVTDLLREILDKVQGDYMVRLGQMNPRWVVKYIDELIELMKDRRVYKYLHLPVQSGDNKVLEIMKRGYTVELFYSIVKELRRKIPGVQIATDVIVGHPGEDEEAFKNTLRLLEELEIDRVHIARFSPRPFTPAAAMPQVPDPVKKRRSKEAEKLYEAVGLRLNLEYLGAYAETLVSERGFRKGTVIGRLYNYRPVVIPAKQEEQSLLGRRALVKVVDATFFDLRAELIRVR